MFTEDTCGGQKERDDIHSIEIRLLEDNVLHTIDCAGKGSSVSVWKVTHEDEEVLRVKRAQT
jgi:hypothetical protein